MWASMTPRPFAFEVTLRQLADGQRSLGDALERLYQSLRRGDIGEIEQAVRETQQHVLDCERLQHDLEDLQAAAHARSLYALLATQPDSASTNVLLDIVERLALQVRRVTDLRHDIAHLTAGLIGINQQMIAAVSQQASVGPVYDAHSSRRPTRINTRLVDASA